MKLTKAQRIGIVKAVTNKLYQKKIDAANKALKEAVTDIYGRVNAKMLKATEGLDSTWLKKSCSVRIIVVSKGQDEARTHAARPQASRTSDSEMLCLNSQSVFYMTHALPGNNRHYSGHELEITAGSNDHRKLLAAEKKLTALIKEAIQFEEDTMATLNSCNSHKQLEETSPQLMAMLPDHLKPFPTSGALVATETVDRVNKALMAA